jgi:hypothetical protein
MHQPSDDNVPVFFVGPRHHEDRAKVRRGHAAIHGLCPQ